MSMNQLRHICSHCGTISNGYYTYDSGWEFNCYLCSCVDKIPDKLIPPELQSLKYKYSVNILKSSGIPQSNFPHYTNKGIKE